MRSVMLRLAGVKGLCLLVGCAPGGPMQVQSYWGTTATPFEKGATFTWRSSEAADQKEEGREEIEEIIRTNVEGRLEEMGYVHHAGSGPPSFWITQGLRKRTQPGLGVGSEEVAGLIIEVTAPADGQLVWRGWAEARIDYSLAPEVRRARIERAVREIMKQFAPHGA